MFLGLPAQRESGTAGDLAFHSYSLKQSRSFRKDGSCFELLDLSELLFQFQKPFPAVSRVQVSTSRGIKVIEMIDFSPSFKSLILERRGFDTVLTGE